MKYRVRRMGNRTTDVDINISLGTLTSRSYTEQIYISKSSECTYDFRQSNPMAHEANLRPTTSQKSRYSLTQPASAAPVAAGPAIYMMFSISPQTLSSYTSTSAVISGDKNFSKVPESTCGFKLANYKSFSAPFLKIEE
jgi:hypothetical protein